MIKTAILLIALVGSSAAFAADPPQTAPAPQSETAPLDKVVCRKQKVFGSLTRVTKTCRTQREWNEIESDSKGAVKGFQNERSASGLQVG